MILFGVAGYLMKKFQYEGAPLVLAYVLGPMLESALRQSLTMADGSFTVFFTRPISAIGMVAVILLLISPILLPSIGKKRKTLQTADLSDS
jgi:putative tricarboxylic transport membrane protein